jgi:hypothetical protein
VSGGGGRGCVRLGLALYEGRVVRAEGRCVLDPRLDHERAHLLLLLLLRGMPSFSRLGRAGPLTWSHRTAYGGDKLDAKRHKEV